MKLLPMKPMPPVIRYFIMNHQLMIPDRGSALALPHDYQDIH